MRRTLMPGGAEDDCEIWTHFTCLKKIAVLAFLLTFCNTFQLSAQNNRKVSGSVTDGAKIGIPNVNVLLIMDKDTLTTQTGDDGKFSFSKINVQNFSLKVSAMGYQGFLASYSFKDKETNKQLDAVRLSVSSLTLKEVVIKAKPNPVRFMRDTVEYNAAAFRVEKGDNVADLIKQLPGMVVDEEYNVKVMDKPMTKLRVNGKDFFTNDVKAFIDKLPAGIVSKLQVIDDYGNDANFTGVKTGEPVKMLNIVTKPGMNKGTFGLFSSNAGTNDMVGSQARLNLWNDDKQSSADAKANTLNNGAGINRSLGLNIVYNDKLGKNSQGGIVYNFADDSRAFSREQVTESLNSGGNFVNNSKSEDNNRGGTHKLTGNLNYKTDLMLLQAKVDGNIRQNTLQNISLNRQSGFIHQDVQANGSSDISSAALEGNISLSKKLNNRKDIFSITSSFSLDNRNNDQNIGTNTRYYDKATGAVLKDSLLNRDVDGKTGSQNFKFGFNYGLGLKKPKDIQGKQSLNFSYKGSLDRSANESSTFVFDNNSSDAFFVDSLSSTFNSIAINQSLGVNYNYESGKTRCNLGFIANVNSLSNHELRLEQKTSLNTVNYSPNINFSRILATGKILSISYQGTNQNPMLSQLQPLRSAQSLQNIQVGNPDLKPSLVHQLTTGYNYNQIKTGLSVQAAINASLTQNDIVTDVSLLPDTLNSLKQVTQYENVNGNYQFGGNYTVHLPIEKNKYSLAYSGMLGFSNRAVIFNHQKTYGEGLNFSQRIDGNLTFKKITLVAKFNYSVTNNNNANSLNGSFEYQPVGFGQPNASVFFKTVTFGTLLQGNLKLKKLKLSAMASYKSNYNDAAAEQSVRDNSNLEVNLSSQLNIGKFYLVDFSATKRANYGYAIANSNPLLINASLGGKFLKDGSMSVDIKGSDLLGQDNNISRMVLGNTIIDSRNRQTTRIFSLSVSYRLSNFGGRSFPVDADAG